MLTEGHIYSIKTKDETNVADVKNGGAGIVITGLNVLRDQIKKGDFVFVVFGGDKPKGWIPGLVALAHISRAPFSVAEDQGRNFRVEIDVDVYFQPSIVRADLVTYPDTFGTIGIGPITKWEPNQAITSVLKRNAIGLIQAICDLRPQKLEEIKNLLGADFALINKPVRRYVESTSKLGAPNDLSCSGKIDLRDEFEKWLSDGRTSTKTAYENATSYIPSIDDVLAEPTKQIWHGLREALYGERSPVRVYAVSSYVELMTNFGGLDVIFDQGTNHSMFDQANYQKCFDWAHDSINHGSIRAAWRWYKKFLQWKDAQKSEAEVNVDLLTVALKQFKKARETGGPSDVRYWVFSPGEQANRWDEMRDGGVMALSYSECGRDLREYANEEAIRAEFKSSEEDDASYKNHVRALTDFLNVMKPGDLVFAKKGTKTFLGVGRVTGEYEFVANAPDYKHRRSVEWSKVETIERDDAVARKTLTDVTRYGDLVRELCEAYGMEGVANADESNWGCQDVRDWFAAFTPEKLKEDFAYFRSRMLWSKRVQGSIGREYAHIDELGAVMRELKESPRPIGYYASEEFLKKCPDGFGKSTATDFLMKFHPNEYISFTGNMMDALDFLGLWPKDVRREMEVCYNELIGAATRVRNRMYDLNIGSFPEGKKPEADYLTVNEFLWWTNEHKDLIKEEIMANTYKKTEIKKVDQQPINDFSDFIKKLEKDVAAVGLKYAPDLMKRFVCAQLAKPFVVLTGLSGSGKTKLAEAFTKWIGVENTVNIVPVGADWTNNEKLLGYPNALDPDKYVMPDTGVLKLMLDANENPDLPFFLILDEMNLSHVERYFADFLSTMESNDGDIELYDGAQRYSEDGREIPRKFKFPKNLFVIGTMNVDETTYMFSPKVLDRAQVIEFRVSEKEMSAFLAAPGNPKIDELAGKGAAYAKAFLDLAKGRKTKDIGADEKKKFNELLIGKVNPKTKELDGLFTALAKLGAEFGYRSAIEMVIFIAYYLEASAYGGLKQFVDKEKCLKDAIDAAVLQKLLPKLHGSLNRLGPVIDALISKVSKSKPQANDPEAPAEIDKLYPLTYEKLLRMKDRVEKNGFTSFAEA